MFNKYRASDHAQRLEGSIVRYKGWPCILHINVPRVPPNGEAGGNPGDFRLVPLYKGSPFAEVVINPHDPGLDISTVPLGYFQAGQSALWIQRNPVRRYRQGVCYTNSYVYPIGKNRDNTDFEYVFCSGFEDMVLGKKKTLEEAISLLTNEKYHSVAISKDLAIYRKDNIFSLLFKKEDVGWIVPGTKVIKVPSESTAWVISRYLEPYGWEVD